MTTSSYKWIEEALTYINEYPDCIDYVKNFNEESGFLWSIDERKFKIFDGLSQNEEHSPASISLTLRVCQSIYKGVLTLEQYKENCGLVDEKKQSQKRVFH